MYNELWLSTFVVIIDDRREISSIGKGAWVLNGLWKSHACDLNMEYVSIQRSHHVSENVSIFFLLSSLLQLFSLIDGNNGSPFQYCRYMASTTTRIIVRNSCKEFKAEDFCLCLKMQAWYGRVFSLVISHSISFNLHIHF